MRSLFTAASLLALAACSDAVTEAPAPDTSNMDVPASETPVTTDETQTPALPDRWMADVNLTAYLDCAREQDVTLLQAHRAGDRPGAAENSIGSIEASLHDGAIFMEIDVAQTADGVLVLLHDDTLDRTTTGTGRLDALTYAEIETLQLVDVDGTVLDEAIPTFADTLAYLDGRGIAQVDLKDISFEQVASALTQADAVDRSVVITYSIEDAITLAGLLPDVALSVGVRSVDDLTRLSTGGVDLTKATIWLGVGTGIPELDAALAELSLETSYGDFGGERNGTVDYQLLADNGAEVISVDDVPAAAAALNSAQAGRTLLANCPAAQG